MVGGFEGVVLRAKGSQVRVCDGGVGFLYGGFDINLD